MQPNSYLVKRITDCANNRHAAADALAATPRRQLHIPSAYIDLQYIFHWSHSRYGRSRNTNNTVSYRCYLLMDIIDIARHWAFSYVRVYAGAAAADIALIYEYHYAGPMLLYLVYAAYRTALKGNYFHLISLRTRLPQWQCHVVYTIHVTGWYD